jgi:hypothetical protein
MDDHKGKLFLFKNDYATSDSHPVKTGNGEISRQTLDNLIARFEEGTDVEDGVLKIDCASWINTSKGGKKYEFVNFDVKFRKDGQSGGGNSGGSRPQSQPPSSDGDDFDF